MEGLDFDARNALLRFALLHHSATQLGVDPQELFDDAATLAPPSVAEAMRRFPRREPEDRTLAAMGYRESRNPDSPLA
jgi:hypothetical protein